MIFVFFTKCPKCIPFPTSNHFFFSHVKKVVFWNRYLSLRIGSFFVKNNFIFEKKEMYSIPHLKSCFWKKIRVFFATPSNLGFFDTFSGGPTGPPKSKTPSHLATSLDDSVLFYFFVRRSLHFRNSEVSALVVSLGDVCNRYIQYLNKVPIATIILHIWMGAKQFIYYLFLIYLLFIYYLFIIYLLFIYYSPTPSHHFE